MRKVKWGVLGAARIACNRVIPAMKLGQHSEIAAIASRDLARASETARALGIPKAYGSYEELLADPEIEAVYNPLPNHLHVPWTIRAAEAGKHVLCEKPIGMDLVDTLRLVPVRERTGVLIGEAFMVRTHPQWLRLIEMVREGRIGTLLSAVGTFSYVNLNKENIRNNRESGGGALMDIGCYPIKTSRMVFGAEPVRVSATLMRDPRVDSVDVLTSAILEFPAGQCVFTVSMQVALQQSMRFFGTAGRIETEIPFNAPSGGATRVILDDGRDLNGGGRTVEEIPPCDQYTIQGDLFSRAIREGGQPPVPLEDSILNMAVIDAVFLAAASGRWERPAELLEQARGRAAAL
jgi:predicted dehydrogenase